MRITPSSRSRALRLHCFRQPIWIHSALALSAFFGTLPTRAQEKAAPDEEPVEVTEIVVRGTPSMDGDLRNTALVTSDEVKEQNVGSVVDAVRQEPGVSIQQTTPGQGTIYVRGFSGRAVGNTVDGVRLNTAFYRAGNNPYLALVDPYSLRRIVIEPGATSVEYGSDALGGAVLMSTSTPYFAPEDGTGRGPGVKLFQSFASNALGSRSHAELTQRWSQTALNLGMTYIRDQDVVPGGGMLSPDPESYVGLERAVGTPYQPQMQANQEGTAFEFFGANATLRQALRSWDITAKAQFGYRASLVRYDRIVPLFKEEYPTRFQAESAPMDRTMVAVSARHTEAAGVYRWSEILLAWQGLSETNFERRWDEVCLDDPPPAEAAPCLSRQRLTPRTTSAEEINRSDSGTARYVASLAFGKAISLRTGLDVHVDRIGSQAWETDLLANETTTVESRYPDGSTMSEGGVFAKAAFRFGALSGYLGARAMGFYAALPEQPGHQGYDRGLFDYSANVGLRYALLEGLAIVSNFGRGVRMPNIADFSGIGARAQGRYQLANYDVAPEHSYTLDLGIKLAQPWLNLDTFVFGSRYADAIILAPTTLDGAGYSPEGDRYYQSENAARIDYVGLDLSFRARVSSTLAIFGRYLAMLGTEHNPPDSGLPEETPADRVPPDQGELGVDFPVGAKFDFQIWGRFRSEQERLNDPVNLEDNRIPEGGTPGYMTLHMRGTYQLTRSIKTYGRIDNLTNALVLDHGSGFYGAGFSASLGIALDTEGNGAP